MKTARYVGIGTVGLILLLLVIAFVLPRNWSVERSIVIAAPPAAIYPLLANMKTGWPQWSTFDTEDPDIRYTYAGPDEGVGATRNWVSPRMGDGSQRIVKADPATGVDFQLVMQKNGFVVNGRFAFEGIVGKTEPRTKVTWTDFGEVGFNPIQRYFAAFLDRMMGGTFEKSLETLKQKVEAGAAKK